MFEFALAMVFTGHMIDAPGRAEPRFPKSAEEKVREAIRSAVVAERREGTVGIAAGASGGDLLFHEVCGELGIPTRMMLALPVEEFMAKSVAPAGDGWVKRFEALVARSDVRVMDPGDGNVWARANLWMVEEAVALAEDRVLIALWDGKGGDGPGGTEHLVKAAPGLGVRVGALIGVC